MMVVMRGRARARFQSTPSSRRETRDAALLRTVTQFQSTPSSRRETPWGDPNSETKEISIHSLLAEGDYAFRQRLYLPVYFNPLPPRGGRRGRVAALGRIVNVNISIHSLLAEGDDVQVARSSVLDISIHSLLAEGDTAI